MSHWNEDRFTALLSPHLDRLYRLAYRLTSRRADAEDLLQDVLIKVFQRRAELTSIQNLAPYLGRVLYNQFIDDKRRYGRQPLRLVDANAAVEEVIGGARPDCVAEQAQQQQRLARSIARLSEEHRVVVLLADAEGYTLAEIEALTEVPIGTLKSRLHRARARLREILTADGTFLTEPSCSSTEGVKRDVV